MPIILVLLNKIGYVRAHLILVPFGTGRYFRFLGPAFLNACWYPPCKSVCTNIWQLFDISNHRLIADKETTYKFVGCFIALVMVMEDFSFKGDNRYCFGACLIIHKSAVQTNKIVGHRIDWRYDWVNGLRPKSRSFQNRCLSMTSRIAGWVK